MHNEYNLMNAEAQHGRAVYKSAFRDVEADDEAATAEISIDACHV